MQNVLARSRRLPLIIAAVAVVAASTTATAVFQAPGPGQELAPVGNAGSLIEILQGSRTVLWTSLTGPVGTIEVEGWPVSVDGNDLGGALVIEDSDDATAGVIDFGERPSSITFGP